VVLAVVHRHLDVHHGKSMDSAVVHCFDYTFLDRRNEAARNRAALHHVDELESVAPARRSQDEMTDPVLSMAAGLFLVLALGVGLPGDGLSERNPDLLLIDLDAEFVFELLDRGLEVALTQSVEQRLVCLAVLLKSERGILLKDAIQRRGQFVVV